MGSEMSAVTLHLPDELAQRLQSQGERVPEIIELGLRSAEGAQTRFNGAGEVLEVLANLPSPEEVLALRPSELLMSRLEALLEKSKGEGLSPAEEQEWQRYEYLEHLVQIAKARATERLAKAGSA